MAMLSRRGFVVSAAGLFLMGMGGRGPVVRVRTPITVYKSSSCGCCAKWVDYLDANGFQTTVHDEEGMDGLKDRLGVPSAVRSCHTALLGKYLIEGHVPAADIQRLLAEEPKIAGLAAPGMPALSPGMAPPGVRESGFDVLAFQYDGSTSRFASY
jgi:hypothetical protein